MNTSVLVVDDDPKIVAINRLYLEKVGYRVLTAFDGEEALRAARRHNPSVVVLDLMLPGLDGISVCRRLRAESDAYVIMLTARSTESDKLEGLDSGADDYITKPFSPRELVARVRAVLRRSRNDAENIFEKMSFRDGEMLIDTERREVLINNCETNLTRAEFDLLTVLARSPERVFTRNEIIERAFGYDYEGDERTIDAHIMNLRKKIEPDRGQPAYITTIFGVGYKFSAKKDVS